MEETQKSDKLTLDQEEGHDESARQGRIRIDSGVREEFSPILGTAVVEGVTVAPENEELEALKGVHIGQLLERLNGWAIAELPAIREYRQMFLRFGANPNQERPSPEALLRRIVRSGKLPRINTLVDSLNLAVVTSQLSMGAYDLERIYPPVELRFARKDDRFRGIGEKGYRSVRPGELVYADRKEVLCRALNYHDCETTKVTLSTGNVLLMVDGYPGIGPEDLEKVLDELLSLVLRFNGGELKERAIVG